jgi:hypothetical protein
MLTATRIGQADQPSRIDTGDIVQLVPVLISATNSVTDAVKEMSTSVTTALDHATVAMDKLTVLPEQFVREAKTGVEEVSYAAGQGFGRGTGWSLLPPLLVGTAGVLALILGYRYVATRVEKRAALAPAYALKGRR